MPKRKKKINTYSPYATPLIIIGLILLSLWGVHRFFYNRSISLSDALIASYKATHTETATPVRITIGNRMNLRVVEAGKIEGTWSVSPTAANHVHNSALPGEAGNIIIYGHNLNSVFGYLVDVRVGDYVSIVTNNANLYTYRITETRVVDPSQTFLLAPTTHEVVTLYTCTGLFDSLRFVARAEPVE